jgi:hypothetical protein
MPDLDDVYSSEEEQTLLALVVFPRYERMLEVVHRLVESAFPELDAEAFRLDDAATRRLLAKAAEQVVRIDETTRDGLRKVLQQGQKAGYSDQQIADGVPKDGFGGVKGLYLNTWKSRPETIARTEIATAQVEASLDRYKATGLVSKVEIVEHLDTDAQCAARNGREVPLSSRPGLLHPNCLPGDQLVSAPDAQGATVREFEGEVVVLRTAADDLLTCTPNHPVLTPRGWVAADALAEGDDVVRSRTGKGVPLTDALDDDDVPTPIQEVARALVVAGGGAALTVPGAAPQFHGDGRVGRDVYVVRADRFAQPNPPIVSVDLRQPFPHLLVEGAHAESAALAGQRPLLQVGGASLHAAHRVVGGGGVGAAPLGRHAPHPQAVALADAPHRPPAPLEGAAEAGGVGAEAGSDILQRYAGLVEPVRLVSVGKRQFRGHVYNLQTERGWYVAQGIITHNCRMSLIPVVDDLPVSVRPEPAAPAAPWLWDDDETRFDVQGKAAKPGWEAALTDGERAAVKSYTTGGYRDLNERLREGTPLTAEQARLKAQIDAALEKAGEYAEPVTVWRGVNLGNAGMPPGHELAGRSQAEREALVRRSLADYAQDRFSPGDTLELGGFQSTSFRVNPALDASVSKTSPGVVFEIRAKRGGYLAPPLTAYDDEAELLLGEATRYRVVKVLPDVAFERDEDVVVRRTVVELEQL